MPVIPPGSWLNPADRPEWAAQIATIGRFAIPVDGGRFDRHFHDDHEVWMLWEGRAKIFIEGRERYVQAGDIILTEAGDTHDFVEVYETVRGFFTETGHPSGGRVGHLHHSEADAAGHAVPASPLPADFPER